MPAPHVQKFFRTYNQEYQYTLNIIKQVQEASRDHPGLFTSVVSILNAAMANKDRGLVAILPELLELLHDAGLQGIAVQCVEYARFVSDVAPDGQSGVEEEGEGVDDHSSDYCDDDDDDEEEEDGDEDDGDDGDDGEEARTRNSPTPCARRPAEVEADSTDTGSEAPDSSQDTECEEQPIAETKPETVASQGVGSKKRKKPPSGLLPQRKSVRQWNRLPGGGERVDVGWALIG
ncbi:hypothetical protein Q9L58_001560 [Maublancomyces gigas]|uniref:Uncharacterized protein n=1 Tax=Discina gigas TaxID=1032678 RepID=A0ABR3GTS4_9PEZI